jgi:hypothetical protein
MACPIPSRSERSAAWPKFQMFQRRTIASVQAGNAYRSAVFSDHPRFQAAKCGLVDLDREAFAVRPEGRFQLIEAGSVPQIQ